MGHIWLIGMMGSGKTTAGELAARMLDRPFLDTDAMVTVKTGQTIPELFSESEEAFREAEISAIASAASSPDCRSGAWLSGKETSKINGHGFYISRRTGGSCFASSYRLDHGYKNGY